MVLFLESNVIFGGENLTELKPSGPDLCVKAFCKTNEKPRPRYSKKQSAKIYDS